MIPPVGWLFIGIAIGFVAGLSTYAIAICVRRRRSDVKPDFHARPSAVSSSGGFANLSRSEPLRPQQSTGGLLGPAVLPAKHLSEENLFYSPLQSSIVKGGPNMRTSTNSNGSSDPAAYGGHGIAILQIQPPAPSQATLTSQGQPSSSLHSFPRPVTLSSQPPALNPTPRDASAALLPPSARLTESQLDASLSCTSHRDQAPPSMSTSMSQQQTNSTNSTPPKGRQQQHQRMTSVAEAYGADELDDEWAMVLGDLDSLLARQGQPGLASPERAVAVRRLIAVTGSRGMQFALEAALQDVMRFRVRQ